MRSYITFLYDLHWRPDEIARRSAHSPRSRRRHWRRYPTIKQWILAGKLRTIKTPGGHHRIPQAALKRYLPAPAKPPGTASRERFRQVSGRNQLIGTIVEVRISGLLAKVVLQIGDPPRAQRITSIITADAVREMQLRIGQPAAALMKSTEVMITRV